RRVAGGEPVERQRRVVARVDARLLRRAGAGRWTSRGAAECQAASVAPARLCASLLLGRVHPGRRLEAARQEHATAPIEHRLTPRAIAQRTSQKSPGPKFSTGNRLNLMNALGKSPLRIRDERVQS